MTYETPELFSPSPFQPVFPPRLTPPLLPLSPRPLCGGPAASVPVPRVLGLRGPGRRRAAWRVDARVQARLPHPLPTQVPPLHPDLYLVDLENSIWVHIHTTPSPTQRLPSQSACPPADPFVSPGPLDCVPGRRRCWRTRTSTSSGTWRGRRPWRGHGRRCRTRWRQTATTTATAVPGRTATCRRYATQEKEQLTSLLWAAVPSPAQEAPDDPCRNG